MVDRSGDIRWRQATVLGLSLNMPRYGTRDKVREPPGLSPEFETPQLQIIPRRRNHPFPEPPSGFRNPVGSTPELLDVLFQAQEPAAGLVNLIFIYHVPFDARPSDIVLLSCQHNGAHLQVPLADLLPSIRTVARLNVALYVDEVFGSPSPTSKVRARPGSGRSDTGRDLAPR